MFDLFKKYTRDGHHAQKYVGALVILESSLHWVNLLQQIVSWWTNLQDAIQATIDKQVKSNLIFTFSYYNVLGNEVSYRTPPTIQSPETINNLGTSTTESTLRLINKQWKNSIRSDLDIHQNTGKSYHWYCYFAVVVIIGDDIAPRIIRTP